MRKITLRRLLLGLLALAAWPSAATATLISYWPLDGNGNAAVGTSGTLVNGPTVVTDRNGNAGGALGFASTSGSSGSYMQVSGGGGLNGATVGTISLWVNWSGTQDQGVGSYGDVLARQSNGLFSNNVIGLNGASPSTAKLTWQPYSASAPVITGTTAVGSGTWHEVAVSFQSGQQRLYLDGMLEGTSATAGSMNNNSAIPLAIGAWIGDGQGYSTSSIDDVGIWSTILGDQQIALISGLSRLAGAALNDPGIDGLLSVYANKGGAALVGGQVWTYATLLPGPVGRVGGSVADYNAYIVLGSGDGVRMAPEPATLSLLALGGLALLRRRRNA